MKSRVWGMVLCLLAFTHPSTVRAVDALRQVKPFLQSLENTPYNFTYIRSGLTSLHAVHFENGVTNQYQPFFNRLILGITMNDKANRIRVLNDLAQTDFGVLGHEAFHAYKANVIEANSSLDYQKRFLEKRAQNLYMSIPESKRAVTLEEAYASWIGWMLQSHISMIEMMERLRDDNCEASVDRMINLWKVNWKASAQGYWYKDSIGEYWVEKFKAVRTLVVDGIDAYKRVRDSDGANFVEEDLQPLDRRWISQNVFQGKISESFAVTFKDQIEKSVCASAFNDALQ